MYVLITEISVGRISTHTFLVFQHARFTKTDVLLILWWGVTFVRHKARGITIGRHKSLEEWVHSWNKKMQAVHVCNSSTLLILVSYVMQYKRHFIEYRRQDTHVWQGMGPPLLETWVWKDIEWLLYRRMIHMYTCMFITKWNTLTLVCAGWL